jgi:hypothetical protein
MQRRHFQLIADTIATLDVDEATRARVARQFARSLEPTNGGFQPGRFYEACGLEADGRPQGEPTACPVDWELPGPEDPLPG